MKTKPYLFPHSAAASHRIRATRLTSSRFLPPVRFLPWPSLYLSLDAQDANSRAPPLCAPDRVTSAAAALRRPHPQRRPPATSPAAALLRLRPRQRSRGLAHGCAHPTSPTATSPATASRSLARGGARPASPAAARRAHRHFTARRRPRRAVPGPGCRHGGTTRHGTAAPPCPGVPCLAVLGPCRDRAARLATYKDAVPRTVNGRAPWGRALSKS